MAAEPGSKKPRKKRTKAAPEPRGLTARQVGGGVPPAAVMRLMEAIEADGGAVILAEFYRHWPRGEFVTMADSEHMRR